MRKFLCFFLLFFPPVYFSGQVQIIIPENMYNGTGGLNGDAIGNWELNNRFENDPLLMSGTGDMRNTFPSDYAGASGSWNVMLNTTGEYFRMDSIPVTGFSGTVIRLGVRKPSNSENGTGLNIEVSEDGILWYPLLLSLPTGTGTTGWHAVTLSGTIPVASLLSLRITANIASDFRIDDIGISGNPPCLTLINSFSPMTGPAGTLITISGQGFAPVTQVLVNGIACPSFSIVSDTIITARIPEIQGSGKVTLAGTCMAVSSGIFQVLTGNCDLNGSGLVISELCDPVNNYPTDRYIEIYNPTSQVIDLGGWSIRAIANFTECETWWLNGTLLPGEAKTCGYTTPVSGGPHDFVQATWNGSILGSCSNLWNGNRRDGAALYSGTSLRDLALYENMTIPWFSDLSLNRADTVCDPSSVCNPAQWFSGITVLNAGDFPSSPGVHQTHCRGDPPISVTDPDFLSVCEGQMAMITVMIASGCQSCTFEWYRLDNNSLWLPLQATPGTQVVTASTTSTLTLSGPSLPTGLHQYYCKTSNNNGGCWSVSLVAVIDVFPSPAMTAIYHY